MSYSSNIGLVAPGHYLKTQTCLGSPSAAGLRFSVNSLTSVYEKMQLGQNVVQR